MAIRILGDNVGEASVAQPGDVTTLRWDVNEILLPTGAFEADAQGELTDVPIIEGLVSVTAIATNRAGEVVNDIVDDVGLENGIKTNSVAFVRIKNLVDGERYKLQIVAIVEADVKVTTITIFVPVVAP